MFWQRLGEGMTFCDILCTFVVVLTLLQHAWYTCFKNASRYRLELAILGVEMLRHVEAVLCGKNDFLGHGELTWL